MDSAAFGTHLIYRNGLGLGLGLDERMLR
jgi:hypothetical protein